MRSISDLRGIFRVGDVLHPSHVTSVQRFLHRDVRHAVGRRGAMPMFFARRNPYDVAGPDLAPRTSLGLAPAAPTATIPRLPHAIRLPSPPPAPHQAYSA